MNTVAAIAIGSSVLSTPVVADAMDMQPVFSTTNIVARTETREGLYQDYQVEVEEQTLDDARSTFKSAKETKSKKGKFRTALYRSSSRMSFCSTTWQVDLAGLSTNCVISIPHS